MQAVKEERKKASYYNFLLFCRKFANPSGGAAAPKSFAFGGYGDKAESQVAG
jgi:hypothetical protein